MSDLSLDSSNRIFSIPMSLPSAPTARQEQCHFEDVLQNSSRVPTPSNETQSEDANSKQSLVSQTENVSSEDNQSECSCAAEQSAAQTENSTAIEDQKTSPSDQKETAEKSEEKVTKKEQDTSEEIVVAIISPRPEAVKPIVENTNVGEETDETNEVAADSNEIDERFKRSTPKASAGGLAKQLSSILGIKSQVASLPQNENPNVPIQKYDREIGPFVDTNQEQPTVAGELTNRKLTKQKPVTEVQEINTKKLKSAKNNSPKDDKSIENASKDKNEKNLEKKPIATSIEQPESEPIEPQEQKSTHAVNHSSQNDATDSKSATVAASIVAAIEAQTTATATSTVEKTTDKARETADSNVVRATADTATQKPTTQNESRTPIVPPALLQRRDEAQSAQQNRNDGSLSEIERVRLVQRVAKAFHTLGNNEGEMKLRLSPPELGAVKLEVTYHEGVLHARMETESASTRNVLMENLPQLKERLAEQNVRIETFDVNVRDQNSGNNSQQQYDFAREQMERARARAQNQPNQSAQIARAATSTITRNISLHQNSTQLNVII